jgi:glycosyltransferase involved in cell wall biosynthesis
VRDWPGHVAQKNRALALCTQPWVLCLDADEALTPELAASVSGVVRSGGAAREGWELNRRTFYLGDWIWHSWYPEWRLRLVRRELAVWSGLDPHDRLEIKGQAGRLQGDLLHYSFVDLADHLHRSLRYARIGAASYRSRGRRFRWSQLLFSPWMAAVKPLVLKQGFRDGWRGWVIAGVKGMETFAKYAFLLEEERARGDRRR